MGYEGENIDSDVVVTLCIQLELGIRSFTLTSFPLHFYGYFFLKKKKKIIIIIIIIIIRLAVELTVPMMCFFTNS
jgi:hypothetical protein